MNAHTYATPHPGEAATLLEMKVSGVEADRTQAIQQLQQKYQGQWVLKGSGSLILEDDLYICTAGAGMGTGGMGDVLAGMIASLKAQFRNTIHLHEIVTLHALAGDVLAEKGERLTGARYETCHLPGCESLRKIKMQAIHLIIQGKVQGVGYRRWFEQQAIQLGLKGFVRNLETGEVEAIIVGRKRLFGK